MRKYLLMLFIVLIFIGGCHKVAPLLDWETFDERHIDQNLSEKGPLGNYRAVFWRNAKGTYNQNAIISYVTAKGWSFTGSEKENSTDMLLYQSAFVDIIKAISKNHKNKTTPQWFNETGTLYKFKFVIHDKSSGKNTIFHSEVLVSTDESQMCVYPLLDDS